ncbi:hypothetical protein OF83DRAFT_1175352 [Amylostereum chailletii]|nr:hypothetical protein OF83DRAFT_1175352 [Amylostereum chailletii]
MASLPQSPLAEFVERAQGQSIPAPRTWAPRLSLDVSRSVRKTRLAFARAEELNSEHHGYEAINEGFRVPVKHYSRKGHRTVHLTPQGTLEVNATVTRRDVELAKDPTFPLSTDSSPVPPMTISTRSRRRAAEDSATIPQLSDAPDIAGADFFYNPNINDTAEGNVNPNTGPVPPSLFAGQVLSSGSTAASLIASSTPSSLTTLSTSTAVVNSSISAASSAAASTSSAGSSILQSWKSYRLTDFLLAVSGFDAEGKPSRRGLVAVVEAKKMPKYDPEGTTSRKELSVAAVEVENTLPQLVQQARYALKQYPDQDTIWGIIIVGRCCQFYKFHREQLPEFKLSDKYERVFRPAEGKTIGDYATSHGRIHRMIEPKKDRYTDTFMNHFHDMMEWSEVLLK